jgi:hypothetical protein
VTRVCAFAASAAAVGYPPCAHGEVGGGVGGVNAATQWSDAHDNTTPGGAVGELVSIRVYRIRQMYSQQQRCCSSIS